MNFFHFFQANILHLSNRNDTIMTPKLRKEEEKKSSLTQIPIIHHHLNNGTHINDISQKKDAQQFRYPTQIGRVKTCNRFAKTTTSSWQKKKKISLLAWSTSYHPSKWNFETRKSSDYHFAIPLKINK